MSRKLVFAVIVYLFFFAMGSALSATTLATLPTHPAPAASPLDTLPQGRHQVSSFTNGHSTEFIVDGGKIVMLKVDGKEIPESEYGQYREQVEQMLGGGRGQGGEFPGFTFDVFRDMQDLEGRTERMEEYFEQQGEKWEKIGEEMGKRFEQMFHFDDENGSFRFEFDSEGGQVFEFNLDSLMLGHGLDIHPNHQGYSFEELLREKENELHDPEREIDELETMIERMERRKAEMEREVEAANEPTGMSINGFNFESELKRLRQEGLVDPGIIRSFEFSQKQLKVNGKKASEEAHAEMLRRYKARVNTGAKFSIELDELDW